MHCNMKTAWLAAVFALLAAFLQPADHSPYLSWPTSNAGVEIHAQKMTTYYTASSTAREKLFPWAGYFQPFMGTFYSFKITAAAASVRLVLNEVNKPKETIFVATNDAASVKLIANAGYVCIPSIKIIGGRDFVWSSSANSLLDIKLEFKQLASIQLQATHSAGSACASTSLANSNYLSVSTAGYISEFSVQCKDSYNNLRTVSVDECVVRVNGVSPSNSEEQHDSRVSVASQTQGKYNALYRTTKSGGFAVNVMLTHTQGLSATYFRDLQFSNVAYNAIEFNTNAFDRLWDLGTPNSQVGAVTWRGYLLQNIASSAVFVTFNMIPRSTSTDKVRRWMDDRFIIDQNNGANDPSASLLLNTNMMYDIKVYYANPSGQAGLKVQWSSGGGSYSEIPSGNLYAAASHVKGSPFSATVFPALTCGTRSIGNGDGLSLATSGIAASFTITAYDHLGNVRTTNDDVFVVRARANVHNNRQAIDGVKIAGTATEAIDAWDNCNPAIALTGGSGAAVALGSITGSMTGCKAVTVVVSGGSCSSYPKIVPRYTSLGVLTAFVLENGGYCSSAPTAAVEIAVDILGTVVPLGDGRYSATYIPTLKRNDAVKFHDLAVSQAVSGGLMATYYDASTSHARSKQTAFVVTSVVGALGLYPAITPTKSRFMGFFRPATTSCTFTLTASTLKAQINGKQYSGTATLAGLVINSLYDIRFELTGAAGNLAADANCIPDAALRFFALHDLAFNTFRGNGLAATYYTPNAASKLTSYIQDINIDWSGASRTERPYLEIPYDTGSTGGAFSARWFGFVQPSRRDRYTFYIQARNPSDSSVSLYVDGDLVIATAATTTGNQLVEYSGTIQFPKAHDWYTIEMKYAVAAGQDVRGFKLSWENDGYSLSAFADSFVPPQSNETVPKQVVPSTRLTRAISQQFIADTQAALNSVASKVLDGTSGVTRNDYSIWDAMSPWWKTNDCEGSGAVAVANDVCNGCLSSANITFIDQTRYRKCRGQGYRANDILRVQVEPAIACSSQSVVQVDSGSPHHLTVATAGIAQSFQLTVRDAYGNIRDSTTQALVSRLTLQTGLEKPFVGGVSFYSAGSAARATTETDPQGRYMVSYTITRSGFFNNDVSLADVRGNGVYGTYFVNKDLTGGSVTLLDANIDFNWGNAAPLASGAIPANQFSVRWTGFIRPIFSELYTFYALANDAVRVYVDNTLVIDRFNSTSGVEYAGTYMMTGNVIFDIKVEYADFDHAAFVSLSYSSPSTPKQVVPNSVLFPALDLLSSSTYGGGRNTLIAWPTQTCATTSTVKGAGLTIATAGIPAYFTIQSYDEYQNLRPNQNNNGVSGTVSTADCQTAALCNWRVRVVSDTVSSSVRPMVGTVTGHTENGGGNSPVKGNSLFAVMYTYTVAGAHTVSTSYLKNTQVYSASTPTGSGLAATYYDDVLFSIPTAAVTSVTASLTGTVATNQVPASSGLKNDNLWSVRYAGHILSTATTLEVTVGKVASASVKVWLDDVAIISDSTASTSVAYTLSNMVATNIYPLRIEYITTSVSSSAHTLSLTLVGGTELFQSWDVSGSTKRLRINPAVASSTRSSFLGRGLTIASAGVQALFTVSCRDEYDNLRGIGGDLFVARAFPAIASASYGVEYAPSPYADIWTAAAATYNTNSACLGCPTVIRASVTDRRDNTYFVAFTPTKKGTYKIVASLARIGGLSASYYNAKPVDAAAAGHFGLAIAANIVTVDFSTSHYQTTPPGGFPAMSANYAFVRWQGFVQPSKAAQYTFSVALASSGADEIMTIWIDNTRVLRAVGNVATSKAATFGFGLANALYDIHITFESRAAAAANSGASLNWESLGSFTASDNVIKQIVPTSRLYARQDVGNTYALNPSGKTSPGGPEPRSTAASTALTVHASIGCATKSVSNGNFLTLATAGGVAMFSISGRDSYQNDRTINNDMPFTVSLYGSGGSPTIQALMTADTTSGSNIYTSQFTASVALSYDVFVKYANDNAFGSPYSLVVKPAQECATRTTITGSGLTAATVNSQAAFTIQSRDSFGNARTQALSVGCTGVTVTLTLGTNKVSSCSSSGSVSADACLGVPVLIFGGVATTPALIFLGTGTTPVCNVLNPGVYTTNPATAAIPQQSIFVVRASYTSNGPIHEIGTVANAIDSNTEKQPMTLNSFAAYHATNNPRGMIQSAGMYQGIYTLTSAPISKASYFIPTMAVKGTLVATYYTGTIDPAADIDTTSGVSACFSGMIAASMGTYAALGTCGATPTAARFAGIVQSTANAVITFSVTRPASSIARIFFRGQLLATSTAGTSAVTGPTTTTDGGAKTNTWHTSTNSNAFDDFFIEVVGDGKSIVSLDVGTVWGNHYLSQPVFSQTITA